MNETMVTLVGNVATAVEYRDSANGGWARFRLAVTTRRWDRQRQLWADGDTSFYTVWAWRTLGLNLAASVAVGEPLVVHGRLRVREEEREGQRRTCVDIDAVAVGHDLTRGTSAFRRVSKAEARLTDRTAGAAVPSRHDLPGARDGGTTATVSSGAGGARSTGSDALATAGDGGPVTAVGTFGSGGPGASPWGERGRRPVSTGTHWSGGEARALDGTSRAASRAAVQKVLVAVP